MSQNRSNLGLNHDYAPSLNRFDVAATKVHFVRGNSSSHDSSNNNFESDSRSNFACYNNMGMSKPLLRGAYGNDNSFQVSNIPQVAVSDICNVNKSSIVPSNQSYMSGFDPKQLSFNCVSESNSNISAGHHNVHFFQTGTNVHLMPPANFGISNPQHHTTPIIEDSGQSHPVNAICHSLMHVNDANNSQQKNIPQSVSHYGQSVGFQFTTSVPSNNQGCMNSNQTQTESENTVLKIFPGTPYTSTVPANVKSMLSFPMCANNSLTVPYGNNIYCMLPVSTRVPPPIIQNIPLHLPPPPPPPKIDNSLPVPFINNIPDVAYEKEMKLTGFLNRFTIKEESEENSVKIPVYRTTLKAAFSKLKELLHCKCTLKNFLHADENTWQSEMEKISNLQNQLSEICYLVSAPYLVNSVIKKLKIIKKKRVQKKRTKFNNLSAKMKKEHNRKKLHQEIDKWLDDIKEKNLKLKREAEMKKEADFILLEVRRKIYEAKRTIEKIRVFEKLRQARQTNSVKKGLHILPEHDESFEKKISILRETMVRQLADYEAEETALKVMLETEQEGQLEQEALWKRRKMKMLLEKKQTHIIECLFGNSDDPLPTDPLYLFHKFHVAASNSIESLLQIRRQWDIFLSDNGETIPLPWVVPTSTSSSWEKWLAKTSLA